MFNRKQQTPPSGLGASISEANKIRAQNNEIISQLAQDYLTEKKSQRRWRMVKFLVVIGVLTALLWNFQSDDNFSQGSHTALIEINGFIGANAESADAINQSLQQAFMEKDALGVILKINSPGGSPVQAAEINDEIRRLKGNYPQKPFYVVISDICTSGGYYIAVAADDIYANRSSLVGSIGVRLDGFGFVESLQKLGIERRLLTAGENKGMLDPFLPENQSEIQHAQSVLREIHEQFIAAVKLGRGDRLDDSDDIFSGLFWSGEKAQELGLIDEFGSVESVARDVIGEEQVIDYTIAPSWFDRFATEISTAISQTLVRSGFTLQ